MIELTETTNHTNLTTEDRDEIISFILDKIKDDPVASDVQWSLFVAALQSYRYDTVLRPFPPMFMKGTSESSEKDIKSLESAVSSVPSLLKLDSSVTSSHSTQLLSLIKWVLDSRAFTLRSVDKCQFNEIKKKTGHTDDVPVPNFIFEVQPSNTSEEKFEQVRQGRKLFYAYHGSRVENFHSILHNGLASHMNKTSVFGEGTYLSSELSVSLHYSPTGLSWERSELGPKLSCVAVCEMIDDPGVKSQVKEDTGNVQAHSRGRARHNKDVPEKYYIVQNNEVVRLKYLLVYSEKLTVNRRSRSNWLPLWVHQHKFAVMMMAYVLILLVIGLANSRTVQFTLRRWTRVR